MIDYTLDQKKAVIAIVFDSMIIDGGTQEGSRNTYFETVYNTLGLFNHQFEEAMKEMKDCRKAAAIIATLSDRERARIAIIMYQLFVANNTEVTSQQKRYFDLIDQYAHLKDALQISGLINWVSAIKVLI